MDDPAPDRPAPSRELLPALADLPGHLLWRAAARVNATLADLTPRGVDLHAYAVLLALAGDVARSQQELADLIGTSRSTMTRVAGAMVEQGLVERVRNPADRRSYALTRTSAGADAARQWHSHAEALHESLASGFTETEHDELVSLLLTVAGNEVPDDAPEALRRSLALLLTRVHAALHRAFQLALEPLGLEPRMVGSLVALTATGPTSQADLARALGISAAHVVSIVDDLEAAGLVERRRDRTDRRTQLLHVAAGVPPLVERAVALADHELARIGLPADDTPRLTRLLRRFVTAA